LMNRQWQSIPLRPPGLDTIEEFRSETNNSSAKLNRPGTVILTTRAGTNQVHGAAFETARNSGIGVARARQDYYLKPPHLARTAFPNNQIPISRESPLGKYLLSVTPAPTLPGVNPLAGSNWFGTGFDNTNQTTITTRVDHRLTDHDQLFFRYSHNPSYRWYTTSLGGGPTTLDGKANAATDGGENDSGVASWTHTFSPTLFSETIFSVQRDHRQITPIVLEDISSELGLPNPFHGLGFTRTINTGFGMDYDSSANLNMDFSRIYNLDVNLTKVYGRHEFQFGGR